jgi:hypothetical protein
MSANLLPLLLAAEGAGYGVGSGRIQGGWEYVWASYLITWAAVALYAFSLWARRRSADAKEPS